MATREELENQVRASGDLAHRLKECAARIGLMCSEGRCPRMSIPVRWDDDDFFIATTLQDAMNAAVNAGTQKQPPKGD